MFIKTNNKIKEKKQEKHLENIFPKNTFSFKERTHALKKIVK